jgi:succinate dehydrogenase/fumarate reductase flavoprotein subunit
MSKIGFYSGHHSNMASLLHNFMRGTVAGEHATEVAANIDLSTYDNEDVLREQLRVLAPAKRDVGIAPNLTERRMRRSRHRPVNLLLKCAFAKTIA